MATKERQLKFPWPKIGHDRVATALDRAIENGNPGQAYIFVGPEGIGKSTMASAFARNLLASASQEDFSEELSNSYSDLMIIDREEGKKNIAVEQVRELIHRLNLSSFLNSYKIGIIKDAQALSLEASNALLKTLEEPRDRCVIILLATSLDNIPDTIASRASVFNFYPVSREAVYDYLLEKGAGRSQAKEISAMSWGRPLLAQHYLEDKEAFEKAVSPASGLISYLESGIMPSDIELDSWLGKKGFNEEAAAADRLLCLWETVLRDIALTSISSTDLMSYPRFLSRFEAINKGMENKGLSSFSYIPQASRCLEEAREMVSANVSAKRAIICALANIDI